MKTFHFSTQYADTRIELVERYTSGYRASLKMQADAPHRLGALQPPLAALAGAVCPGMNVWYPTIVRIQLFKQAQRPTAVRPSACRASLISGGQLLLIHADRCTSIVLGILALRVLLRVVYPTEKHTAHV